MADEQQLPGLRIPLLRWTPIQFCLALCSGFYIAFPLLGPYRLLVFMLEEYGIVPMMVLCPVAYVLYGIQLCLGIALTKWVLLQRIKPSMTRLGSFYHLRWWFVDRLVSYANLLFLDNLRGTPMLNLFFISLGAKISLSAYLDTADITAYDLVTIKGGSVVLSGAGIRGHSIEEGELVFGTVELNENCYVGPKSIILPDTVINPHAIVRPMTVVRGFMVEGVVEGSPPSPVPDHGHDNQGIERGPITIFFLMIFQSIGLMVGPALSVLAAYPAYRLCLVIFDNTDILDIDALPDLAVDGIMIPVAVLAMWGPFPFHAVFLLIMEQDQTRIQFFKDFLTDVVFTEFGIFGVLWVVIVFYAVYSAGLMLAACLVKWIFLTVGPRPKSISISNPIDFLLWFRRWVKERMMVWVWYRVVLLFLGSEVTAFWMRINGGRVGGRTVFAKIDPITDPDLLNVGWDCHFGDGSMALGAWIKPGGEIDYSGVNMEDGALIGMHGLLLPACNMGEECILGALSLAGEGQSFEPRSIYFGTPSSPLFLSKGSGGEQMDIHREHTIRFYLYMFLYPFLILALTMIELALGGYVAALVIVEIRLAVDSVWLAWVLLPCIFGVFGFTLVILGIFNKWLFIFRFREFNTPAFSALFHRRTLGMALNWFLGDVFLNLFVGTPFLLLWLRLLGARLDGWRTYIESVFFTEPDLIEIGDTVIIERSCLPFCHVLESGWLLTQPVVIGAEARVGTHCVLLPGVKLSEGTVLSSFSCAAKSEVLPPYTYCSGCPVSDIQSRMEGGGEE